MMARSMEQDLDEQSERWLDYLRTCTCQAACAMLVVWADQPGDAPEMLQEAVEAARAALHNEDTAPRNGL